MDEPYIYDKAEYHHQSVVEHGLGYGQAGVHTAFFLGWIVDNDLYSKSFARFAAPGMIERYKARDITALHVYDWWDSCLADDMLSDRGNAFARAYFDFDGGLYIEDYRDLLVCELPSEFHVADTWENYAIIRARIDERYRTWKVAKRRPGMGKSPRDHPAR